MSTFIVVGSITIIVSFILAIALGISFWPAVAKNLPIHKVKLQLGLSVALALGAAIAFGYAVYLVPWPRYDLVVSTISFLGGFAFGSIIVNLILHVAIWKYKEEKEKCKPQ